MNQPRGGVARISRSDIPRIRENLLAMHERKQELHSTGPAASGARALARGLTGVAVVAIAATVLASSQAVAAPIACGSAYTAAKGDTLFKIARRAYGDGWKYKALFEANRDLLPKEESLEVDAQILVPCLDGSGPATRKEAIARGIITVEPEEGEAGTPISEAEGAVARAEPDELAVALAEPEEIAAARAEPEEFAVARAESDGLAVALAEPEEIAAARAELDEIAVALAEPDELAVVLAGPDELAVAHAELDDGGDTVLRTAAMFAAQAIVPGSAFVGSEFSREDAAPSDQTIRLVTGSGFAPYADKALPEGGIITDLVSRAFEAAAPERAYRVSFVDDWDSHVETLLPIGAFEIGFPWFKPDCSQSARLSDPLQHVCAAFEFSKPIFEVEVAYYARVSDPLAGLATLGALSGKRLCRPAGQFTFDLEQAGLVAPNVSLETNLTAEQCFAQLAAGEIDVVTMPKPDADAQMRRLGLAGVAVEIAGMRSAQYLHAIAPKSNPAALAALEIVNRGLGEVMLSGRWFEIVASHLDEREARLAGS